MSVPYWSGIATGIWSMVLIHNALKYIPPLYEKMTNELIVEKEETSHEQYSRSNPENLRCVVCSRMFPPLRHGQQQTSRTYCFETARARNFNNL